MKEKYYTYLWLREDGTPYYVGKGTRYRAFVRHRVGNAPPEERILLQRHPSEEDAFAAEVFLISYYGRKDLGTGCLWNMTDGGEGASGRKQSEESIAKRVAKVKGIPHTPEWNSRIAAAHKGRKASDEARVNMSRAHKGQKRSPDAIAKTSEANRGRKRTPEQVARIKQGAAGRRKCGPPSAEHRANLSKANKGKKQLPEHIAKRGKAIRREKPCRGCNTMLLARERTGKCPHCGASNLSAEQREKKNALQRQRRADRKQQLLLQTSS